MVADVTMSLDNVLAVAAAAQGRHAAGLARHRAVPADRGVGQRRAVARLMTRHAWIIWVGGGILGYVAGEMITDDPVVRAVARTRRGHRRRLRLGNARWPWA